MEMIAMLWVLYNICFSIAYVLMLPHFLLRMCRRGGYAKDFLQRLGRYKPEVLQKLSGDRRIWVHAVSVGEIFVALKFVDEIRRLAPGSKFVLSTTTSTGHRLAESKLHPDDVLIYFPADFPVIVKKVLRIVRPRAIILTESEIWPNMVRIANASGIPVIMINGRISESSYRGYMKIRMLFRRILKGMSLFMVQSEKDRSRLVDLGADPAAVKVMGSAKYDTTSIDVSGQDGARRVLAGCGMGEGSLVIVGGSTWPGEETILLGIMQRLKADFPNVKLVLVPRHAERAGQVEAEIRGSGLAYVRRSMAGQPGASAAADVLLVDTTGELKNFYACADVIFVGKSITSRGGQNVIEPAVIGKPIVVGPLTQNFECVVDDFLASEALIQVDDAAGLEAAIRRLLGDGELRAKYSANSRELVVRKKGIVRKSVDAILPFIRT